MNNNKVLEVQNVTKSFDSEVVLQDVSLQINKEECHCLVGKNGSGKSTLINIIIDVYKAEGGIIKIFGHDINENDINNKKQIGVLPEFDTIIEDFNIYDYLEYVGLIYGLDEAMLKARIEYLVSYFFDKPPHRSKPIHQYSKGMKLKVGICASVIHKPKLVIMDEPFDGLDIFSSNVLAEFINYYRSEGNSFLISSHDLLYLNKIATHLDIIRDQKIFNFNKSELADSDKEFENKVTEIMGYNIQDVPEFK